MQRCGQVIYKNKNVNKIYFNILYSISDTMYTERYMDTPQENIDGYRRADLMSQANKLRGRRYLIVHGTGDDNVHFQHSMQFAKELQRADIPFEQMVNRDID